MSRGPRALLAAAFVLTAGLGAAPFASTATADSNPLDLAGRYGCDDGGDFVEITIGDPVPGAWYQVGVLPPGRTAPDPSADAVPDAVTAPDADRITVRVAQPIEPGGDAYVKLVATGEVDVVALPDSCKRGRPRVPQLPPPRVAARVASGRDCAARTVPADKVAIVTSVNVSARPTRSYLSASGLTAVFYNLALVDVASNRVVDSRAVSFPSPATGTACLVAPSGRGTYQVRAIGTDGTSTATNLVQVVAGPPRQVRPPPTPNPAPSQPAPRTGRTATPVPAQSVPTQPSGRQPGGTSGAPTPGTGTSGSGGAGTSAGGAPSSAGGTGQPGIGGGAQHPGAGTATPGLVPVPNDSGVEALRRLAEPPADAFSTIFVWQAWAALIVLGFALVTGALIAVTVRQARRR